MITGSLILFISFFTLWFMSNEYPVVFGFFLPTSVLKRRVFMALTCVLFLLAVASSGIGNVSDNTSAFISQDMDSQALVASVLSVMIALLMLKYFSVTGSSVYAFCGAMAALSLTSETLSAEVIRPLVLTMFLAPLFAFLLSALIRYVLKITLGKSGIHIIILSHYMRIAVIVSVILISVALGLNLGGFLMGTAEVLPYTGSVYLIILVSLSVLVTLSAPNLKIESDESAGIYYDFSIYTVLSVGLSVSLTFLFFSFDASSSLLGLSAMPLSMGTIVFASIAGSDVAQKSRALGKDDYIKEMVSFIASPCAAFLVALVLFYVFGLNEGGDLLDYMALTAAIVIIIALAFAGYIKVQYRNKTAIDRLVYSQQQQIYEHSRALNDMELKVILSENQALHNALEMKRQEVMNVALSIVEQKEYLESLNLIVGNLSKATDDKEKDRLITELKASLKQRLSYDRDVDSQYFYAQAESLHEDFNAKLTDNFPDLTQQERRLATLLRLGFSSKYIATLMNITTKSVEISRYRLRQKLRLSKGENLVNFIKSI